MTDLRPTIIPNSSQLNADDLIGGPRTIKVTKVSANPGSAEQPIAISFEGDDGKPYLPCKSMRRVLVNTWGHDGNTFAGRTMTLYRDDKVVFGGLAVGGIRISHLSHIDKEVTLVLTATRASRKPFTVKPLKAEPVAPVESTQPRMKISEWLAHQATLFEACETNGAVDAVIAGSDIEKVRPKLQGAALERLDAMIAKARERVAPTVENAEDGLPEDDEIPI